MSRTSFVPKNEENDGIHNILEENISKAKESKIQAKEVYYGRIKTETENLKIVETEIPSDIIPNCNVLLYDVRVDGRRETIIYKKDKWIRQNIPRGLTFIEIDGEIDFAIFANRKFSGCDVEDDSCVAQKINTSWETFFTQPPGNATEIVCMDKLDGEAAHFAVRKINEVYYIIAGSKNVHLLFETLEDIEKYTDSRYLVAKDVARAVFNTFAEMDEEKLSMFKDLLDKTKITVVCELMQPHRQHITHLSHFKEPTLNVLMFSSIPSVTNSTEESKSLTALPAHLALKFANYFGFKTPAYKIIPAVEINDFKDIKSLHNTEGNVLYYLLDNNTIGMVKIKTVWYVMLLTLREKGVRAFTMKKKADEAEEVIQKQIDITKKQFMELQDKFGFSDEYRLSWETILESFMRWLKLEINEKRIKIKELTIKFPVFWENFLKSTSSKDKFQLTFVD